jgi:trk system potassium uptake protein TrkH
MGISRFITPPDFSVLLTHLGGLLKLFGVLTAPPLLVSMAHGEFGRVLVFAGVAAGSFAVGWLLAKMNRRELELKEALILVALGYLLYAFFGALLFLGHESFVDGFFEAMSGFSTTGLTVVDLETLPKSLLFFRAWSQWIGGAGIAVLTIAVLTIPGRASLQLFEAGGAGESLIGNVKKTARVVTAVYGILTGVCFFSYLFCGMPAYEGLLVAMATVSTGGFVPFPESAAFEWSAAVRAAVSVFMILGAVGLPSFYWLAKEGPARLMRDRQVHLLAALLFFSFLASLALPGESGNGERFFHIASALSTTGLNVSSTGDWNEGFRFLVIVLMFAGGATGSTAGGIKLIRILILTKLAIRGIDRLLLPREAEVPLKVGGKALGQIEINTLIAFVTFYAGIFLVSSLLLMFHGYSLSESCFESASALGTAGLTSGMTGPELPVTAKFVLIFDMWAGRVEILPVAILFRLLFVNPGKVK